MQRLLTRLAAILVAFSLLVVAARLSGQQPEVSATALLDPGACEQPCWHGIQIGKTTVRQAVAMLKADKARIRNLREDTFKDQMWNLEEGTFEQYEDTVVSWEFGTDTLSRWFGHIDSRMTSIDSPIQALTVSGEGMVLGNAILFYGDPIAVIVCPTHIINISALNSPSQNTSTGGGWRVWAIHALLHGSIEVIVNETEQAGGLRLDPQMEVNSIVYYDPADEPPYRVDAVPWQGLAHLYRLVDHCDIS